MARKVKWAMAAWSDLESVARYIARDSEYYAAAFMRGAREAARTLGELPERGRVVPEFGDASVRELFVKTYRLIYKVDGKTVYIIGFIHGARDLPRLWKKGRRESSNGEE